MGLFGKTFEKAKDLVERFKSKFDKQGSYTGSPSNGEEAPEQDADDL